MIVETLLVFVTVAEQSNFSRAADLLNLSQPGVSLHIRNLENELGVKLLHRSSKYVKLTEEGQILFKRSKQILSLYEEAKQEIHLLRNEVTGSLKIGASLTIGENILPKLLAEYVQQFPQVDTQVNIGNTEEIVHAVRANELDIGLVEGKVTQSDIEIDTFMRDELLLVASPEHPLASLTKIGRDSLQEQSWILRESGSGTRAFSDQFIREEGLAVRRSFIFNSSQGVKEAVAAGLGISILSRWAVRRELKSGDLIDIPLKGKRLSRDLWMIQGKQSSKTMAKTMFVQKLLTLL